MSDYALEVHYSEADPPVVLPLPGCDADAAETARQAIVKRIEHAIELRVPRIYSGATGEHPEAGVPIEPGRVTSVDLVER